MSRKKIFIFFIQTEYKFTYRSGDRTIEVELEHEYPVVEIEMKSLGSKYETRVQVSDFVDKEGTEFSLKNEAKLREIVSEMAGMVE